MIQKKICIDCEQVLDLFRFTKRASGGYRDKCQNCALGTKPSPIVFIDGGEPPAVLIAPERRVIATKITVISDKGSDYTAANLTRTTSKKTCPCCKEVLDLSEFVAGYCTPCNREKSKIRQREKYAKSKLKKEPKRAPSNKVQDGCKKCRDCQETKPITDYYGSHNGSTMQYDSRCKTCIVAYKKARRIAKKQQA